ncbi:MAG: CpsD/CapB family tyrosine-protein kinase [Alphaproteobacteria bacterium]|nr:CpsD/CapB family tyrosine-protein kinase [Alphaproteobacteria bacterium]
MDRLEKALEKSRQDRINAGMTPAGHGVVQAVPAYAEPKPDIVPDEALLERNRIIAHRTRTPEADIYRQLRTQILHIMQKSGLKTLAITSPHYGDGKTTVAINLGLSIALDLKQTVLMVDLDLRKPNLHQYMGAPPQPGLTDHLLRGVPLADCLTRPAFERINTLPAGSAFDNSSELIGSPGMIALARELKERYPDRLVIYDMPPVLAQDDPIAFLPQVDAVLVVVRDGITRADDLKRSLHLLSGANVIGTVLNNCW